MNMKKYFVVLFLFLTAFLSVISAQNKTQLLTVAEKSDFTSTSTHAEVMEYIKQLQKLSPNMRVETIAKSAEGKAVPLLIIGKPLPKNPASLKNDKRIVVYYQANIHAGEVEGKEAALMFARDILLNPKAEFLDKVIFLIVPIYNSDGNDKISVKNRTNQNGPINGVGDRYNGMNLDLNRDAMKAEAPETQGLIQNILNKWDPALVVDCHTTDGSFHQEPVTFCWAMNPNGSMEIKNYLRDKFFPVVSKTLKEKYNTMNIVYGEYIDRRDITKGWEAFSQEPRYVVNYAGLRNRLSILNENNVYIDYKSRVLGCYNLLRSMTEFCYTNKDEIKKLIKDADDKTIARGMNPTPADSFAIEYKLAVQKDKITLGACDTYRDDKGKTFLKLDQPKYYTIPFLSEFSAKRSVRVPYGYFITTTDPAIPALLTIHGISFERLKEPFKVEVESFKIKEMKPAQRIDQGHYANSVKGDFIKNVVEFPKGTIYVSLAQINANVAMYLLEPQTDDSMLLWNFFDRAVGTQWGSGFAQYPVHRLLINPKSVVDSKFVIEKTK